VGDVNAQLLGSILVTKIYLAAMSRADSSASTLAMLPNFYFYVDEFQNFANQSFADILSEARKYKLNLIIAHQYVEQMEEEVRDAVFGNVGTTIAFRVGPFDAEVLETIFQPVFMATDLVNLGVGQIYLTLMIDGVGSPPFSAATLRAFDPPPANYFDEVIANSRAQYGRSRQDIEKIIEDAQLATPFVATDTKPKVKYTPPSSSYKAPAKAPAKAPVMQPKKPVFEEQIAAAVVEEQPAVIAPVAPVASAQPEPQPVAPFKERVAEVKEKVAKAAEHVVHEPRGQSPQVRRDPPPKPAHKPAPKVAVPQKPPLAGSTSLRDALAQAQANASPAPAPRIHAPDLKSTLHTLAPQAEARPVPARLPEDEIRSMLDVDDEFDLDLS
jgi:hypothetical protein